MSDSAQVTYAIPISVQTTASLNISMKDALKGIKNDSSLESVNWLNTHAQSSTARANQHVQFLFQSMGKPSRSLGFSLPLQRKTSFIMPNILILQRYRPRLKKTIRPKPKKTLRHWKKRAKQTVHPIVCILEITDGSISLSTIPVTISKTVLSQDDYPAPDTVFTLRSHTDSAGWNSLYWRDRYRKYGASGRSAVVHKRKSIVQTFQHTVHPS